MWFLATGEACQMYQLILVHKSAQHPSRLQICMNFEPRLSTLNIHFPKDLLAHKSKYTCELRLEHTLSK